jgi:hypothetical protein
MGEGGTMNKTRLLLAALCAAGVAASVGASAASAGEVTGNCNNAKPGSPAAENCKQGQNANANSICSFSGQNDDPSGTQGEGPGGRTQSYGQDVRNGFIDPHEFNPGDACRGGSN